MLKIRAFTCEGLREGLVTDSRQPGFAWSVDSDRQGARITSASLRVNGWQAENPDQTGTVYAGPALSPFTAYTAELSVTDDAGEQACATLTFRTGRLDTPWQGKWISDPAYQFTGKGNSPVPMVFRKSFDLGRPFREAVLMVTALGVYEAALGGEKVGDRYFAPGFTSYFHTLQYQTYDVTEQLRRSGDLTVTVAGGWAVGSFVFTRKNRYAADRQALLAELRVTWEDGGVETFGTDGTWQVTEDGPVRMADLYDGETYDATVSLEAASWRSAAEETLRVHPALVADSGAPVIAHQALTPVSSTRVGEETVYDFGQNFAGVIRLRLKGRKGQTVNVRHAEILNPDGSLNTAFLRTAKATAAYTCAGEGVEEWSPRFTYMGFRYAAVKGIDPADVEVSALPLWSDVAEVGGFTCSDPLLNRLQQNILWGARSNFVDIPTDCPQRDERMGWTGDIAVFAPTACFNFDMRRFLDKWLRDVRSEQNRGGGIPNTVPVHAYGFPATMPRMAIDWWGDACVLVPWAVYQATGDASVLRENYAMMKKYIKACRFWAGFGFGKQRYIWHTPATLHFGDWVAPDVPKMQQWQARSRWTATASLHHTSGLVAEIAGILGEREDEKKYRTLSQRVAGAYRDVFTDGKGKLLNEFQTGYVLPLYFHMFPSQEETKAAAANLAALAERGGWKIGTGFPGTPYILFALADNGQQDAAFHMLMNTDCPSWLYEVKVGATTIWERWDGLDEKGQCPIGDDGTDNMISYNHYASGAVGDFLYRRVAGLEALEPGYRRFRVKPLVGGGLTSASAWTETPYGRACAAWELKDGALTVTVEVPVGAECELELAGGKKILQSGRHVVKAGA